MFNGKQKVSLAVTNDVQAYLIFYIPACMEVN